jgi:hypothetical protein
MHQKGNNNPASSPLVTLGILCWLVLQSPGWSVAQGVANLLGSWQAEDEGGAIFMTLYDDGSYLFEIPTQTYRETGSWQQNGDALTQTWHDVVTGELRTETYRLERLADGFIMSEGNLSQPLTFTRLTPGDSPPTSIVPPSNGELPLGRYACYTLVLKLNYYTSDFYPVPVPFDTLTIAAGHTYTSELGEPQAGTYQVEAATGNLQYLSGHYLDLALSATFASAQQTSDGVDRITQMTQTPNGTLQVYCDKHKQ